jgi:hypothetical protein
MLLRQHRPEPGEGWPQAYWRAACKVTPGDGAASG